MGLTGLEAIPDLGEEPRIVVTPAEAQAAEYLARTTAAEMGIDYDHLAESERQLLILATKDQLISEPGDERIPETKAYTAKDFDVVPLPIEKWLESKYHMGKWYYENLFDAWKEEIVEVINKDAIEWIICLQGDTVVPLLDGRELPIRELAQEWSRSKKPLDVYSYDSCRNIVPGRATQIRCTGVDQVCRVWLDDGTYLEANPRHQFVLLNGQKRMVRDLMEGDSLAPLYRAKSKSNYTSGYETVYCSGAGKYRLTHEVVAEWKYGDFNFEGDRNVIHHKDFNKFNNAPWNLEKMPYRRHYEYHGRHRKKFLEANPDVLRRFVEGARDRATDPNSNMRRGHLKWVRSVAGKRKSAEKLRKWNQGNREELVERSTAVLKGLWENPEWRAAFVERRRTAMAASNSDQKVNRKRQETKRKNGTIDRYRKARVEYNRHQHPNLRLDITLGGVVDVLHGGVVSAQKVADVLGCSQCKVRSVMKNAGYDSWPEFRASVMPVNHKVVRVEYTGRREPVYCMTVDRHHNFAVLSRNADGSSSESGVISSNTGSVGSGKTTAAILANLYKLYVVTCMKDPCSFYSSTTITFGMFSVAKYLAQDVEANMLITRIMESEYFRNQVGMEKEVDNPRFAKTAALAFPKKIRFTFGSLARHGLGQDIFGGIMDEVAFDDTPDAQKVRGLYAAVKTRIESRFMTGGGRVPGLLCVVSSANREGDFLDEHLKNTQLADKVHVSSKNVYQVKPFPGARFRVLVGDKLHSSRILDEMYKDATGLKKVRPLEAKEIIPDGVRIEMVPVHWYDRYVNDIEQALRDISGIALFSTSPFIPNRERLYELVDNERKHPFTIEQPVIDLRDDDLTLESIFLKDELFVEVDRFRNQWQPRINPGAPRFIHADLAKTQDCAGLVCVHLYGFKEVTHVDNQGKEQRIQTPVVYVDFALKIKPPRGSQIDFTKIQSFLMYLRHIGMNLGEVTFDQYQSTHFQQLLLKAGIESREISMDRNPAPYLALKQAIMAGCVMYYGYTPLIDELAQLQALYRTPRGEQTSSKLRVDHPPKGCFVGTTRIPTLDGRHPQISELDGEEAWVYSCMSNGDIVPGKARGRITKMTRDLVDVILDNGAVERCTPDHRWMLRDGTYREAKDLRPGIDRLMPINRIWPVNGGYERLTDLNGEKLLTHHMVVRGMGEEIPEDYLVHHKNHDKMDNRPENLSVDPADAHHRYHTSLHWKSDPQYREAVKEGARRFNESADGRRKHSEALRRTLSKMTREEWLAKARAHPSFRGDITLSSLERVKGDPAATNANAAARILGCGRNVVVRVLRENGYMSWGSYQAGELGVNHKVRAVVPVRLKDAVPVYDLEVDRYHNFALCGGVFVHNSKDCADALAGAHKACIESKYTEVRVNETQPVIDLKPKLPQQGPTPGDPTGSSWV